ncbi:MAG TPA: monovalent cation/H(+) antiporter subunit G [Burkholderiales bacterium]|nr:monovalent cation/H(+) antiporter subunit G [Burkholderiales bacterium]
MTQLAALSPLVAVIAAACILAGAIFALIGSIGLIRLRTFYERIHPPTLGTTFGTAFVALGSMILFSTLQSRLVLNELVLVAFVVVTTPITYTLLLRASVLRESLDAAEHPEAAKRS